MLNAGFLKAFTEYLYDPVLTVAELLSWSLVNARVRDKQPVTGVLWSRCAARFSHAEYGIDVKAPLSLR